MNISFFITPKCECAYIDDSDSLRQALEKMERHRYSAIPILTQDGKYYGSITEGDLLWGIKNQLHLDLKSAEKIPVVEIPRRTYNKPVGIRSDMEDLIGKALNQNFVPVIDDQEKFIGIVTRKDIMEYFYRRYEKEIQDGQKDREETFESIARERERTRELVWEN